MDVMHVNMFITSLLIRAIIGVIFAALKVTLTA